MHRYFRVLKESVEIPIFIVFFAIAVVDPVHTIYVTYQTCVVLLGYNASSCELLATSSSDNVTQELRNIVQPRAAVVIMTSGLIGAIIPVFLCVFLGPWSDRNGRRVIMLVNLGGYTASYAIKLFIVLLGSVSPWYFIIDAIPVICTGGFSTFLMVVLCYLTDKTTSKNRGLRMAGFECAIGSGLLFGMMSSSFILERTNYATVYSIAFAGLLVSFMFTYAFIPETVIRTPGDLNGHDKLFTLIHVKDMVKTTVKKREDWNRSILFLIIGSMLLFIVTTNSGSVPYWYLSNKFHWPLQQYTLYISISGILGIIGTIVGVYLLHKLMSIRETLVLIIGYVTMFLSSTMMGLAEYDWQIYTAGGIKTFGGVVGPMMRSLISKIVPAEDIGKVFALTIALECLMGVAAGPLYTIIYNNTVDFAPQTYNFVTAAIYIMQLVMCFAIMILQNLKDPSVSYNTMGTESEA